MSVYKKLMEARVKLQGSEIKKTGVNKFASYSFFELSDFLPTVQEIFKDLGMCGVVSFTKDDACLTVVDTDNPVDRIVFNSPMSEAQLKGCHPIQNLGAVQSYLRRYLWVTAMEIVEHDALDSSEPLKPEVKKASTKDAWSGEAKPAPVPAKKTVEGNGGQWNIKISEDHDGQGWPKAAFDGAKIALELASTTDDVLQIFKTNRSIFEQLQQEDGALHADLMDLFKTTKAKLQGE